MSKSFGLLSNQAFLIDHGFPTRRSVNDAVVVSAAPSSAAGKTVLSLMDGRVLSVQADGSLQTRDPGIDGPFEQGVLSGNIITYHDAQYGEQAYRFAVTDL